MNEQLEVLGRVFKQVFDLMRVDYHVFGVDISIFDVLMTGAVIHMLLDILLTYAGYERNE